MPDEETALRNGHAALGLHQVERVGLVLAQAHLFVFGLHVRVVPGVLGDKVGVEGRRVRARYAHESRGGVAHLAAEDAQS